MRVSVQSRDCGSKWALGIVAFGRRHAWHMGANPFWPLINWRWQRKHRGR